MNPDNFKNSLETFVNSSRQTQLEDIARIDDLIIHTYQTMIDVTVELKNLPDMLIPIRHNLEIEVDLYNKIRGLLIDFLLNYYP